MSLSGIDIIVFISYFFLILLIGFGVTFVIGRKQNSKDYFFAGNSLPWWVLGASVIAANISAEQFIGMTGSGYAIGLGIATYEWLGALGLLIVAKFFLPIYLKNGIFTMPGFLEKRFSPDLRAVMAVFWLMVYWFVNISSVLYLGALVLKGFLGVSQMNWVLILACFSGIYAVFGGLRAVAYTDVVQVIFLVLGGLLTTYFAIRGLAGAENIIGGLEQLISEAPQKFDMILSKDNPNYKYLPGIGVLLGGLWVANIAYFGCNQYIIQRSLAAKSIGEAQKGMVFAAFLKLFIPVLVVLPGIVAFVINAPITKPDEAYSFVLNSYVPQGFKGLAFAALIAAVVSSLSSMVTSASTIFVYDLYIPLKKKMVKDSKVVGTGRFMSVISLLIPILVVPYLETLDQVFQYIQNFTGMVTPGIAVIFLLGLFWKRATSRGALWVLLLTIPVSVGLDILIQDLAFLDRMGLAFMFLALLMIVLSLSSDKKSNNIIIMEKQMFHTNTFFNVAATGILMVLGMIYYIFW